MKFFPRDVYMIGALLVVAGVMVFIRVHKSRM
jgi:hypothetical protein